MPKGRLLVSCGLAFLLGGAEQFAEAFADDHFFAVLHGHRDELDVVDLRTRGFAFWLLDALMHGGNEAWVVGAEDFNDWVACAKRVDAVVDRVAPSVLIPVNPQSRIAVSVVRDIHIGP